MELSVFKSLLNNPIIFVSPCEERICCPVNEQLSQFCFSSELIFLPKSKSTSWTFAISLIHVS